MTRTRASAKKAGASFERQIADYLCDALGNPNIDRMVKSGSLDRGDIANVRDSHGRLLAIECKNTTTMSLPQWEREATTEALNYGAHAGVIVHKRRGTAQPQEQWVTMTTETLAKLLKAPPTSGASNI
ncbi:hypothetical protein ACMG4H_14255 [Corynebacterium glutamicum]|uniref:putative PDDEXK endonuclease n=1 Tax=Corynebacterium glutamicum TaxID=1718 RepID=UPI003C7DD1ED